MPDLCQACTADGYELEGESTALPKKEKRLDYTRWVAAFGCYALAAAATEVNADLFVHGNNFLHVAHICVSFRCGVIAHRWLTLGSVSRLRATAHARREDAHWPWCTTNCVVRSGRRKQPVVCHLKVAFSVDEHVHTCVCACLFQVIRISMSMWPAAPEMQSCSSVLVKSTTARWQSRRVHV